MTGQNFYNEIDPFAAQMLRNLIAAGHIAPGVVDERSIEDIYPEELHGYTQCHFFAGVGVWSLALRRAGWPDDRPVWTGSCPCQPFSAAGQGHGFDDKRHLWPHFHWLIEQRKPASVLGEQVASRDADAWIDLVQDDLEALGYAVGAVPFPSAGVGAPHIRDRLYWVAHAADQRQHGRGPGVAGDGRDPARLQLERLRHAGGLADAMRARPLPGALTGVHRGEEGAGARDGKSQRLGATRRLAHAGGERLDGPRLCVQSGRPLKADFENGRGGEAGRMADTDMPVAEQPPRQWTRPGEATGAGARDQPDGRGELAEGQPAAGPTNGYWRDADWLGCRDGKWRPVEPGTSPLAHGAPARVGRLRAYGNAINAEAARVFVQAVMESL